MAPLERRDRAAMLLTSTPACPGMVRAAVRRRLVTMAEETARFLPLVS